MPTAEQIQQAIAEVHNQPSFIKNLLTDTLNWPIDLGFNTDIEDITYEWTDEELRVEGLSRDVLAGPVLQMQSLEQKREQPWGIFILEFKNPDAFTTGRGLTGPLRKVLRGLCRRKSNLPAWDRENLLFICTHNYEYFRFAYFKDPKDKSHAAPLTTFGWEPGTPARTTYENLCYLEWPDDTTTEKWVSKWTQAFDVEKVNKKFYTQIAQKFTDLVGGWRKIGSKKYERPGCIVLPTNDEQARKEFAVRLIGRLVFCWFLKKKHSEPDNISLVPRDILSLDAANSSDSYYHFVLEPLFFEVLNKKLNDRNKKYKTNSWDKIPFLNGGLFTPHSDDYYNPDDFQGISPRGDVKVPDEWLRELLEIFERYNFTIEENTPLDIELSIDPEMLGRIFENLLAEINPETGETARKATGSYYTPRPIVEYMVDQSIKQYLLTQTNVPEEKIASLLLYADKAQDAKLTEKQIDAVIEALDKVKVLDPGCGSGAFPIGILQKMLLILQKVDPDSKKWKTRLLAKIPNTAARKALAEKLESETWQYIHKLGVIQNSIYGVDIQPIAAEISKLRVFLSLIVDETVNDSKENRGIEPLPNLEFKFVCANTLIGLPETKSQKGKTRGKKVVEFQSQTSMFEATDDIAELKKVIDNYFTSYGEEKERVEKKFSDIQSKLRQHMLDWGKTDTQTAKLADWNPFGHDSCPWFDPKWMFCIDDGFDIVIGNPPYVNIANLNKTFRELYKKLYRITKNKVDLYAYFIVRGLQLTCHKGTLVYIVSHTWKATTSFERLRKFLFDNYTLKKVVDLNFGVFQATVKPAVILVAKEKRINYTIKVYNHRFTIVNNVNIKEVINDDEYRLDTLCTPEQKKIFLKIESDSQPLSSVIRFSRGIKTSDDKRFILKDKANSDCKKVYRGKNIKSYQLIWAGEYVWYRPDLMKEKVGCLPHSKSFFEVPEKIITQRVNSSMKLLAAYDDGQNYFLDTTNVSNCETWDTNTSLKFLCGLINSKLINFYYCNKYRMPTIGCYELHSIPIKKTNLHQNKISHIVEQIINIKRRNVEANTLKLERNIDQVVYDLYDLKEEEIAIVEKGVP